MLRIAGVSKSYGSRAVLRDLSLTCGPGQSVLVMGANGSGKSTFLKIVAGLIEADRGRVLLDDLPLSPGTTAGRRRLGYLPDATDAFPDLTVGELAALTIALKRADVPPAVVQGWRDRLGLDGIFHQRLRTLSLGQRKRAFLLSAVLGDPWLLILDEPSNGLDPAGATLVAAMVAERRQARLGTLIASNDRAFARAVAGRLLRLVDGVLGDDDGTAGG